MEIYVYSRSALEAARPHEVPHIIISISSSPDDLARIRVNDQCRGVLRLSFPDADAPSELHGEETLFSKAKAEEIWKLVRAHQGSIERLIVHCDAGLSRSPGVAAAISKALTGDDSQYFGGRYRPNMRVYRTLLEAYDDEV